MKNNYIIWAIFFFHLFLFIYFFFFREKPSILMRLLILTII